MQTILIRYAEIALKKGNRSHFEKMLITNIKNKIPDIKVKKEFGRIYLEKEQFSEKDIFFLQRTPGIKNFSFAEVIEKDYEIIKNRWLEIIEQDNLLADIETFKFETKRADKSFPIHSDKFSFKLGAEVRNNFPNAKTELKHPDTIFYTEIRDKFAYIYTKKIQSVGGLPTGSAGKGICLLSGGIDSPVAAYRMMKRGMKLDFIHFESPPYTSESSRDKVLQLAKKLRVYQNVSRIHIVNFTKIQMSIRKNCDIKYLTLLMRRAMMEIASRACFRKKSRALVTGEALAQVASQTLETMSVTNASSKHIVLRPLVGMDKEEIIKTAKHIDTLETSNLPYEDCCTVFVPKHPETSPRIEKVLEEEEKWYDEEMINEAVNSIESIKIELD